MNLGGPELIILVGIAVLLFGAGWLPKAARNLGKAKVEFDEVQKQFNEAKDSAVKATGVKQLESTVRKANKVMNTSPQKMMKDAAKSAVTGSSAAKATEPASTEANDDAIEDAEIVDAPATGKQSPQDDANKGEANQDNANVNVNFD